MKFQFKLRKLWKKRRKHNIMARNMNITKFKPHIIMIISQIGWTLLYFITAASFNHGMNPYVYITYRHIVAGVVMLPFAYFLERLRSSSYIHRKSSCRAYLDVYMPIKIIIFWCRQLRPKLTVALLAEIFVLSLFG